MFKVVNIISFTLHNHTVRVGIIVLILQMKKEESGRRTSNMIGRFMIQTRVCLILKPR